VKVKGVFGNLDKTLKNEPVSDFNQKLVDKIMFLQTGPEFLEPLRREEGARFAMKNIFNL